MFWRLILFLKIPLDLFSDAEYFVSILSEFAAIAPSQFHCHGELAHHLLPSTAGNLNDEPYVPVPPPEPPDQYTIEESLMLSLIV